MDRVFLDANVLFSTVWSKKNRLRTLWDQEGIELLSSAYRLEEARRNLLDHKPAVVSDLEELQAKLLIVPEANAEEALPESMVLPEKDVPVFLAAIASQATHFLTGDFRHFGSYRGQTHAGILILAPADYLDTTTKPTGKNRKTS